ncbi:MAG: GTP-binding protein [Burkholderiales bacterium]|nr:GTP-binding protein [Burkholderiales bacterium]
MPAASRVPAWILTGFLGSGKTTLLRHLLAHEAMRRTACVINELGEVGLDDVLVREVTGEVVLLASGCVCCSVRDDLASALDELQALAESGKVPAFGRVVVETTGLADPAPVMQTLIGGRTAARYRLAGMVAAVDSVLGWDALDAHPEALKQAALADCLVLTKTDLARAAALAALHRRLARLNSGARRIESALGRFPDPDALFDPAGSIEALAAVPAPATGPRGVPGGRRDRTGPHDRRIGAFTVRIEPPVDWTLFHEWLELILASRGENLLRLKGIVRVAGRERPVVIQCVQHMAFPPAELRQWPDADRATRLTFITRDLSRGAVERSLREVLGQS